MTQNTINRKNCLSCDKPLHGRSDKKFCNDYCRNAHNNSLRSSTGSAVRQVNNALSKNRRILQDVLGTERTTMVSREALLQQGFNFRYITHTYTTKQGGAYCFCYEMGYLSLENSNVLVVCNKKEAMSDPGK